MTTSQQNTQQIKSKFNQSQIYNDEMSILIVGRIYQSQEIQKVTKQVINKFTSIINTIFYFMTQDTLNTFIQHNSKLNCLLFIQKEHQKNIDFIITIGGDGTLLYAAKEFFENPPPFLSFHHGTLGFLCKFNLEQLNITIQRAIRVKNQPEIQVSSVFKESKVMRLAGSIQINETQTIEPTRFVMNEIAVTRLNEKRVILDIIIDNEFITTTTCDGILISTPTGSTAYSLSCGGPVMLNGINCIMIVPMAPNSLSFRPICVPTTSVIIIRVHEDNKGQALVSFDGQTSFEMNKEDQIQIKYDSKYDLTFYEPRAQDNDMKHMPTWMKRLKHHLGWNHEFQGLSQKNLNKRVTRYEMRKSMIYCFDELSLEI